jgi:hypothetical protein
MSISEIVTWVRGRRYSEAFCLFWGLYHSVLEPYDKKSLSEKMLGKIRRPVSHFEEEAIMRMECFSWEEQQKDS